MHHYFQQPIPDCPLEWKDARVKEGHLITPIPKFPHLLEIYGALRTKNKGLYSKYPSQPLCGQYYVVLLELKRSRGGRLRNIDWFKNRGGDGYGSRFVRLGCWVSAWFMGVRSSKVVWSIRLWRGHCGALD